MFLFVSKAATYEHLAPLFGGLPTWAHYVLYGKWGKGEWGMVTTGNVQVSSEHLTLGCDLVIPERLTPDVFDRYTLLAAFMKGVTPSRSHGQKDDRVCPLAIMQLSHAGRQSTNIVGGRWPFQSPLGPSATRVGGSSSQNDGLLNRLIYGLMFQEARAMTTADIKKTVDAFVRSAKVAEECGFDGIQLHAAHGCTLISPVYRKTILIQPQTSSRSSYPERQIIAQMLLDIHSRSYVLSFSLSERLFEKTLLSASS